MDDEILNLKKLTLESEDSSYDSDYDTTDTASHNDVSRTVSDTLGQEFEEYVTTSILPNGGNVQETNILLLLDDPLYQSRVDFARKLGYSEEQVKIVLSKLGPAPSQNELLAELIQLDCSNTSAGNGGVTSLSHSSHHGSGSESCIGSGGTPKSIILRHVVIDGSNLAMSHGNNHVFSCRGIKMAVDYFKNRGHKEITVFLPSYRKEVRKPDDPVTDREVLFQLEKEGILVFTPSRTVGNKRLVCYDDRYIIKLAAETDGIVVSNDNYRDLIIESPEFKKVIIERMLMYSFVNDRFMPPEDPLGRNGPTLGQFLSKTPLKSSPPCPYGRKCTYGIKCKYFHPIIKQSVSDSLRKQAALKATQSLPLTQSKQIPISRTRSAVGPLGNNGPILGLPPNPHKKLQRQLSINPVNDPRINLCRTDTGGSSSSIIPVIPSSTYLSPFPTQPGLGEVWSPPSTNLLSKPLLTQSSSIDEDRQRIFFHLTAIFPQHQVTHVMNLLPHETDPQVICRHIVQQFT